MDLLYPRSLPRYPLSLLQVIHLFKTALGHLYPQSPRLHIPMFDPTDTVQDPAFSHIIELRFPASSSYPHHRYLSSIRVEHSLEDDHSIVIKIMRSEPPQLNRDYHYMVLPHTYYTDRKLSAGNLSLILCTYILLLLIRGHLKSGLRIL